MQYVIQGSQQLLSAPSTREKKTMATEQRAPIDPEVAGAEDNVTSLQATVQVVASPLRHNPRTDCPTYMDNDYKPVYVERVGGRI